MNIRDQKLEDNVDWTEQKISFSCFEWLHKMMNSVDFHGHVATILNIGLL